jgi:hypothetical protein
VLNLLANRLVRLPIIMIGVVAWLAISNHCAIAAIEGVARMPMPSCHGGAAEHAPTKHNPNSGVECCKVLRATLLTLSSNLAACDTLKYALHDYVVGLTPIAPKPDLTPVFEWDTGPPGTHSFAESVLQRSVLAPAPPVLA